MIISLKKFGTILTSRELGKEAFAAFLPNFSSLQDDEKIYIDFSGVDVFSPSWGDEFLTALQKKFTGRLILKQSTNSSVAATLDMLQKVNDIKFDIE